MPNILVVDDEMGMREGCRRALARHGYQVSVAEHGTEGLRMLREEAFDLVLLDAMMPGLGGLEFLDRVQERDPNIICVMITGYATVDLAAQAMKRGAQGFLPKPFNSDELLAAVRSGLEERTQRLALRQQEEQEEDLRQLERTHEEQAKLDAIASRFLLVVVHELRNPAGVIKNYLDLMRGGYVEQDERDEVLAKLNGRAGQLLDMLDDLLELAHLKEIADPGRLTPVAVAGVLEEVVQQLRPAAEAKGLDLALRIEAQPSMLAQVGHLRSMWRHLIDNAIRYTLRGRVTIALSVKPGWLVSTVSDTGIGIAQDDLARIFQEFYRSEGAKEEAELGTGLGLPIVCQILRLYQGNVEVDSAPGTGSTFTVALPLVEPGPEYETRAGQKGPGTSSH
jgi:signal transduction histidine kinase